MLSLLKQAAAVHGARLQGDPGAGPRPQVSGSVHGLVSGFGRTTYKEQRTPRVAPCPAEFGDGGAFATRVLVAAVPIGAVEEVERVEASA